jgi:choline dehydrogenase-like flavoprotein
MTAPRQPECEYLVVGSGAGGATVAARLAEAGKRVVLLEAGGDPRDYTSDESVVESAVRLRHDYDVPAFHAFASENPAISWDFFVRHYDDDTFQRRDPKFVCSGGAAATDGIYYPRASALGGCTAHNAMILVYPHNADWDNIAALTGDRTWSSANMRKYFERLEDCGHRPFHRVLSKLGVNLTRHGWSGWLKTQKAIPKAAMADRRLKRVLIDSVRDVFREDNDQLQRVRWFLEGWMDPNDWRLVRQDATGIRYLPLSTSRHARTGARERALDIARRHPDRLTIVLNAFVTKVILDDQNCAVGVEYFQGERLYRAHRSPGRAIGEARAQLASREVILAGGAFNTPQLLLLSGIGPEDELRRFGIRPRVVLPGVGKNLQDRYEIGVVNRMSMPIWQVFEGATFGPDDPQFAEWSSRRTGVYATNGAVLALFRRSTPTAPLPDLFCMSMLANFHGYYPGYSKVFAKDLNSLTWVVLKGHTGNHSGTVTLCSSDPLDTPAINFRYFSDQGDQDLRAVVEGIRFVRRVTHKLRERGLIAREEVPGDEVVSDADLADFVRVNTWGHHACGTCAIGPPAENGVVNSNFQVHHVRRLRVVDASVFPRIPGFFIVSAVYMIGEKAADSILAAAAHETSAGRESR